jgi:activator of 2-hydroxyglutaryl-CoA dehydratase
METPIIMTGGVVRNQGIVEAVRKVLKAEIHVPEAPQIVGALGAALSALKLPFESVLNPKGMGG